MFCKYCAIRCILIFALTSVSFTQISYRNTRPLTSPAAKGWAGSQTSDATPGIPIFRGWKHTADAGALRANCGANCVPSLAPEVGLHDLSMRPANTPAFSGFGLRPTIPAGTIPTDAVTADFNGDGHLDWAIVNGGDNSIWVYLGRGNGTANPPTIINLVGASPIWLTAVSLRNNGIVDLVIAEADSNTIGVLLGNGDGTFQAEAEYSVPAPPIFVVAADFNGDGKPDIAAGLLGIPSTGPVAMLPGDGSGHLGAALFTATNTPSSGVWLSIADLNKDGSPDLVIVDSVDNYPPHGGAQVYLNNGNGTFQAGQNFDLGTDGITPFSSALADLNGDGCIDAVDPQIFGVIDVYLGNCDGTFQDPPFAVYELGDVGYSAQLVDLNHDGNLDFVTSGFVLQGAGGSGLGELAGDLVCVMFGDGTGHFASGGVYRGEPSMIGIALGDFNEDGFPDIVTANEGSNSASIFLNDGHGGFGDPQGEMIGYLSPGVTNSPSGPFLFADLNGDGFPDIVSLENAIYYGQPMEIAAMLNDGTGKFAGPIRSPAWNSQSPFPWSDIVLADFRNTGQPDLLAIGGSVAFVPNTGGGHFGTVTLGPPAASGIMAVGDFNGDGKLDFVTATEENGITLQNQLSVFLGNGDGTFRAGQTLLFGAAEDSYSDPTSIFAGDFNRDGKLDVMVLTDGLYEMLGNGDGTFQAPILLFYPCGTITLADVNHDGWPDIIGLTDKFGAPASFVPTISIFLNQPDGTFKWSQSYTPYADSFEPGLIYGSSDLHFSFPIALGDFNGDHNLDLAIFQSPPAQKQYFLQILYGNGDGTFTPGYAAYPWSANYVAQFAADVDGDGLSDLIELDNYVASFNVVKAVSSSPAVQLHLITQPVRGNTGWGRVTLSAPSGSSTTVSFTTSDPNVTAPSVVIPAGTVSEDFSFSIGGGFNTASIFTIQAQAGSATATADGYVSPLPLPIMEFAPSALSFGYGNEGSTLGPLPITLYNRGNSALPVSSVQTGLGFSQTNNCGNTLAAGGSCTFQVSFQVSSGIFGLNSGYLTVFDTVHNIQQSMDVWGYGLGPSLYPCCLSFNTPLRSTSPAQTVTLTNRETSAIDISSSLGQPSQGFSEKNNCDGTLAAGGSCQFSVQFTPQEAGATVNVVSLSIKSSQSSEGFQITLFGNGTDSDFQINAQTPSQSIKAGQTATYDFSLSSISAFSGTVALQCSGFVKGAACSVTPSSEVLTQGETSAFTVNIKTSASGSAGIISPGSGLQWSGLIPSGLAIPAILLLAPSNRKKPRRRTIGLAGLLLFLISCGGGGTGGSSGTGGGATSGTPAGSYQFTVSGASGSLTHSVTINLNVQ